MMCFRQIVYVKGGLSPWLDYNLGVVAHVWLRHAKFAADDFVYLTGSIFDGKA